MKIAATGHRPKYFSEQDAQWLELIKSNLRNWLKENRPTICISGMAIGWDLIVAEMAIDLNIELHAYIPFPNQDKYWDIKDQILFNKLLAKANKIETCSKEYFPKCYLKRDRMMVNDATHIVALLDPAVNYGGTYYTVQYAKKNNRIIKNFWI